MCCLGLRRGSRPWARAPRCTASIDDVAVRQRRVVGRQRQPRRRVRELLVVHDAREPVEHARLPAVERFLAAADPHDVVAPGEQQLHEPAAHRPRADHAELRELGGLVARQRHRVAHAARDVVLAQRQRAVLGADERHPVGDVLVAHAGGLHARDRHDDAGAAVALLQGRHGTRCRRALRRRSCARSSGTPSGSRGIAPFRGQHVDRAGAAHAAHVVRHAQRGRPRPAARPPRRAAG